MRELVEAGKLRSRHAAALVVEGVTQMSDDSKRVIELKNAGFDISGIESCDCAAEIAKNGVVKRDDKTNRRSASCCGLLVSGGGGKIGHHALASCWLN